MLLDPRNMAGLTASLVNPCSDSVAEIQRDRLWPFMAARKLDMTNAKLLLHWRSAQSARKNLGRSAAMPFFARMRVGNAPIAFGVELQCRHEQHRHHRHARPVFRRDTERDGDLVIAVCGAPTRGALPRMGGSVYRGVYRGEDRKAGMLAKGTRGNITGSKRGKRGKGKKGVSGGVLKTPPDKTPTLKDQGVDKELAKQARKAIVASPAFEITPPPHYMPLMLVCDCGHVGAFGMRFPAGAILRCKSCGQRHRISCPVLGGLGEGRAGRSEPVPSRRPSASRDHDDDNRQFLVA
jgi:hypothetical protein